VQHEEIRGWETVVDLYTSIAVAMTVEMVISAGKHVREQWFGARNRTIRNTSSERVQVSERVAREVL
jgi:hypothetical protein